MSKPSKNIFQTWYYNTVRMFASPVEESIERNLREKITAVEQSIRQTQLEINHHQHFMLDEINKRVKNSGTLVFSDKEILTKIFSGLKMYLDPRDLAITPHLALDGIWEHRITIAWLSVIKPYDVVLDIGSNNGYYGALAAQKTDRNNSKVVMFEANPHLIPYIQKTIDVNFLGQQSVLENLAIADKEGTLTLNVLKDYVGSSSVYSDEQVKHYMPNNWQVKTQEAIKVRAVTIDGYCQEHAVSAVSLILMDIEGFEDKAYAGMRRTIAASPDVTMFIEFTRGAYENPKAFYDQMLADFGHVYIADDEGYITKPPRDDYETVIGESDDWVMPIFSKKPGLANR